MEDAHQRLRIDRDLDGRRRIAFLLHAVDDRRDLAGDAQATRFVLASGASLDRFECRFHKCFLSAWSVWWVWWVWWESCDSDPTYPAYRPTRPSKRTMN